MDDNPDDEDGLLEADGLSRLDDVAETPDITITAESFKIHAGETVSTGDYENADYNLTITGAIDGGDIEAGGIPLDVRSRLMRAMKQIQKDIERAGENRVKIPDAERWKITDEPD